MGVPSMALDLTAAAHGYYNSSLQSKTLKLLDCIAGSQALMQPIDLDSDPYLFDKMSWCHFPGAPAFKLAKTLNSVQADVEAYLTKVTAEQAWMTDYAQRVNFSTPFRIDEMMEEWPSHVAAVDNLLRNARTVLEEFFDDYTVSEWAEQKIWPLVKELRDLKKRAEGLRARRTWPARPLPPLKDLQAYGYGQSSASSSTKRPSPGRPQPSAVVRALPAVPAMSTARPKRLVQAPDYYRHPPGSR